MQGDDSGVQGTRCQELTNNLNNNECSSIKTYEKIRSASNPSCRFLLTKFNQI